MIMVLFDHEKEALLLLIHMHIVWIWWSRRIPSMVVLACSSSIFLSRLFR
jgi:hypothetical protein